MYDYTMWLVMWLFYSIDTHHMLYHDTLSIRDSDGKASLSKDLETNWTLNAVSISPWYMDKLERY